MNTGRFCRMLKLLTLWLLLAMSSFALAEDDGHLLLSDRDIGVCKRLTGEVEMTVLLVDLEASPWDQESRKNMMQNIDSAMEWLEQEAASYGAQLDVSAEYCSVQAAEAIHMGDDVAAWAEVLLSSDPALPSYWIDDEEQEHGPLLICLNTGGRAFACSNSEENIVEYCLLYEKSSYRSICHELLHLYGAWDYYTHDDVAQAAKAHCSDSIMLKAGQVYSVDSLTAYVIGWTDEMDAEARAFLADTAHLTEEAVAVSAAENMLSGFRTETTDAGVYTGMFQDGMYHGWGTMQWKDGSVYEGQWDWSARTGIGTAKWTDGNVYTGGFKDGAYEGIGRLRFAVGGEYVGEFSNGRYHGMGTFMYADGSMYAGEFANGQYHGTGRLIYADGNMYAGEFVNGKYHGTGTLIYADGSMYAGEFANGLYHGMGTLIYADGTIYTGIFVDNQPDCKGIRRKTDGTFYIGEHEGMLKEGMGTFLFSNGDLYTGDWEDDQQNGQGTYVWPETGFFNGGYQNGIWNGYGIYIGDDGTVLQGIWEDGAYIGE